MAWDISSTCWGSVLPVVLGSESNSTWANGSLHSCVKQNSEEQWRGKGEWKEGGGRGERWRKKRELRWRGQERTNRDWSYEENTARTNILLPTQCTLWEDESMLLCYKMRRESLAGIFLITHVTSRVDMKETQHSCVRASAHIAQSSWSSIKRLL